MHRRILIVLATCAAIAATWHPSAFGQEAPKAKAKRPPNPALAPIEDKPGLPRVLLIGDSISVGYTMPVREALAGKANVHRPADNCGPTSRGVQGLDRWLGDGKWDVIHVNFGLHDLRIDDGKHQVPIDEYEKNLRTIVARLKKTGATLIWCSTTPVPEESSPPRKESDVLAYNAVAKKIMDENGIKIDDLHGFALPRSREIQISKNVHFSDRGYDVLAGAVAASILDALPKPAQAPGADATRPWDLDALAKAPKLYPAPDAPPKEGVRALYYEGLPWQGRPTRVFAYYGTPDVSPGTKVPAVVLLHGGGGTAFPEWVRLWNRRGYAAIAPALEGQAPGPPDRMPYKRHEFSGPIREGIFADMDKPIEDQWYYHAVADAVLADSLLRSFPEVDADRIGLTGISWGGILTSTVAGVDPRFRFAVPVYGCGFLMETPIYSKAVRSKGDESEYLRMWDPALDLPRARMPMLWVNGTNDIHFPLNAHAKSSRLPQGPARLCVRIGMKHGHPPGWEPREIDAFADSIVKGGDPLALITAEGREAQAAWARYESSHPIQSAKLVYTTDPKDWVQCEWLEADAQVQSAEHKVTAKLPDGCRGYFFNLTDDRGLLVSTAMEPIP